MIHHPMKQKKWMKIFVTLLISFSFMATTARPLFAQENKNIFHTFDAGYVAKDYDVAVENLTAVPSNLEFDGLLLLSVSGKLVNRGTQSVKIAADQVTMLPDMQEATTAYLQKSGTINQDVADALDEYGDQSAFTCVNGSADTDCTLEPGESKTFSFNQPSYFMTITGALVSVAMNKTLTKTDDTTIADQNTSNNLKYVLLYTPTGDPDIAVQGLTATPNFDEGDGSLTGVNLSGYIINLSKESLVSDFQDLVVKVNGTTQSDLAVDFDYSAATSDWKQDKLDSFDEFSTLQAGLETFFDGLAADTLYPGGKAYFSTTLPTTDITTSNVISVTFPSTFKTLTVPSIDADGDGKIETSETRNYLTTLTSTTWKNGTDTNTKNNRSYLLMTEKVPGLLRTGSVQTGEYLPALWAVISGMIDQYQYNGTLLPEGWKAGSNFPDSFDPGKRIPDICVTAPDGSKQCPGLPQDWTPASVVALIQKLQAYYSAGTLRSILSSKVSGKLGSVITFLRSKAGLSEIITSGITKVTRSGSTGTNYGYQMFLWNRSSKTTGDFKVKLNIKGEKEIEKTTSLGKNGIKKITFNSTEDLLTTGGNLLHVRADNDNDVTERNEFNNDSFREVVLDKDGNMLMAPQRYFSEPASFINSFYYIAYPFVKDTDMYDASGNLKKVTVQSWIVNISDSADTGKFHIKVYAGKKGSSATCTSQYTAGTDFGSNEWKKYGFADFEFTGCNMGAFRGRPAIFELERTSPNGGTATVVARRLIIVP